MSVGHCADTESLQRISFAGQPLKVPLPGQRTEEEGSLGTQHVSRSSRLERNGAVPNGEEKRVLDSVSRANLRHRPSFSPFWFQRTEWSASKESREEHRSFYQRLTSGVHIYYVAVQLHIQSRRKNTNLYTTL